MFLTYLETERLAADAAAIVAAHGSHDGSQSASLEAAFEAVLDAQAAVMTVRGSVREDFLESRGLSRT